MKKSLGLAAALLCLSTSSLAQNTTPQDQLRSQLARLLEAKHSLPKAEQFKALGPQALPLLKAWAEDANLFPLYRSRALEALSYYPDPQTFLILERALTSRHVMDRHRAVHGLAMAFPQEAPTRLGSIALGDDPRLARTALLALRQIKNPAAKAKLQELRNEPRLTPVFKSLPVVPESRP